MVVTAPNPYPFSMVIFSCNSMVHHIISMLEVSVLLLNLTCRA